jgi:hypothetical protein
MQLYEATGEFTSTNGDGATVVKGYACIKFRARDLADALDGAHHLFNEEGLNWPVNVTSVTKAVFDQGEIHDEAHN